ncbi:hypothetical protein ON010_g17803 [Phytophthora cinnamomi]|nr:hypothetical protein ON010_g17803 [Phytophthora cinnamomi]
MIFFTVRNKALEELLVVLVTQREDVRVLLVVQLQKLVHFDRSLLRDEGRIHVLDEIRDRVEAAAKQLDVGLDLRALVREKRTLLE